MKTFLWTSLFWIVAVIAGLLCLGFGNLGTQVLENNWIVQFLPNNVQAKACEPIVASKLSSIDRCAAAEANNCNPVIEETESDVETSEEFDESLKNVEKSLQDVITNQQVIFGYLQESFASTNQAINNISIDNAIQETNEPVIDERELQREQQRLQLQAQIEALQNEMANL